MKIRNGFVSNSSSSSFIIIECGEHIEFHNAFAGEQFHGGIDGEHEFGWGPDDVYGVYGVYSKINFAFLQNEANVTWRTMLENVIKEQTSAASIVWHISSKNDTAYNAYIDHQSAACEGQNTELFDSEEKLKDFLFNPASYIHLDNDNY